jgi:type II secretory pathway pseudopilin PulG
MISLRSTFSPDSGAGRPALQRGFTLLDVALGLLALALALSITVAEFGQLRHRRQRDQFATDLRALAGIFENYRAQKGEWPAATNPDLRIPPGMESVLAATPWVAGPPFGGAYDWVPPARPAPPAVDPADAVADKVALTVPPPAANEPAREAAPKPAAPGVISITAFSPSPALSLTAEDLRYLDARLDDGNLATGRFRVGFNGWPVYQLNSSR